MIQMTDDLESNFTLRVPRKLKESFRARAKQNNRNGSILIRDFMLAYEKEPQKLESSLREALSGKDQ